MKKLMTLLLAGMMLLGMVTVAGATTTISNIDDGTIRSFGPFGEYAGATVGQTFRLSEETIGDDNFLDSVTFWIEASEGDIEFKFYLYEWDGTNLRITGDSLSESDPMSTGEQAGNLDPTLFTVDVGGVELDVDQDYVFSTGYYCINGQQRNLSREFMHFFVLSCNLLFLIIIR